MATAEATNLKNQNPEPEIRPSACLRTSLAGGFVLDSETELLPTRLVRAEARMAGARTPYTLEIPSEVTDSFPLLIIGGLGGTEGAYTRLRQAMASRGKPAITFEPPRAQKFPEVLDPGTWWHPELLQASSVGAVIADIQQNDHLDNSELPFDLLCHSYGGLVGSMAAIRQPEIIRTLLLNASVGLDGEGALAYATRLKSFIQHEVIPGVYHEWRIVIDGLCRAIRRPARMIADSAAASLADIRPLLPLVRAGGAKVAACSFSADRLVPIEKPIRELAALVDFYAVFPIATAGHYAPQRYPAEVAEFQLETLRILHGDQQQDAA